MDWWIDCRDKNLMLTVTPRFGFKGRRPSLACHVEKLEFKLSLKIGQWSCSVVPLPCAVLRMSRIFVDFMVMFSRWIRSVETLWVRLEKRCLECNFLERPELVNKVLEVEILGIVAGYRKHSIGLDRISEGRFLWLIQAWGSRWVAATTPSSVF